MPWVDGYVLSNPILKTLNNIHDGQYTLFLEVIDYFRGLNHLNYISNFDMKISVIEFYLLSPIYT